MFFSGWESSVLEDELVIGPQRALMDAGSSAAAEATRRGCETTKRNVDVASYGAVESIARFAGIKRTTMFAIELCIL